MIFLPRLFRGDKPPSAPPAGASGEEGEAGAGAAEIRAPPPAPPEAPAEQSAAQQNMSVQVEGDRAMTKEEAGILVSEAQIAVHWRGGEDQQTPPQVIWEGNAGAPRLY